MPPLPATSDNQHSTLKWPDHASVQSPSTQLHCSLCSLPIHSRLSPLLLFFSLLLLNIFLVTEQKRYAGTEGGESLGKNALRHVTCQSTLIWLEHL
jgi:hypothetical protein